MLCVIVNCDQNFTASGQYRTESNRCYGEWINSNESHFILLYIPVPFRLVMSCLLSGLKPICTDCGIHRNPTTTWAVPGAVLTHCHNSLSTVWSEKTERLVYASTPVTSHEHHGVQIHRPLDFLLNNLFMLATKKTLNRHLADGIFICILFEISFA